MAFDVGAVFIPVLPNLSGFGPALNKGLSGATSGISAVGAATTAAAVGLGVFAAASVKAAIEFDRSFTKIAAISNTSAGAIEGMKDSVMALSGETAVAPTELADALFFLSSAGLDANEVMPALEASAKAAAVGLGDTADVANIVASAMNAYAASGLTAAEVTDTLVAAVREGRAEPEEFANALGRILPIASAVGVSFDQVAASMAALSNIGLDVNEGVTAMRGVLQAIAAPGSQAAEALGKLGLSAQELLDAISEDGIIGALRLLDTAAKEQTDTQAAYNGILRKVVPNVRALTGVLGLTVQEASKVNAIYDAVKNSTGDLGEAFRTTAESDAFQLKQAFNDISIAGQEFARDALPGIAKTMKTLAPIIEVVGKNLGLLLGVMVAFKVGSFAAASGATAFGAALGPIAGIIAGAIIAGQQLNEVFYGTDQTVDELAASLTGKLEPALDAGIISASQYAEAARAIRDPTFENVEILFQVQKALYDAAKAQEVETASKAAAKVAADTYVRGLNEQAVGLAEVGTAAKRFGGMSKEAFAEFKQGLEDAVNVAVGEFETLNDAFDQTPAELQKALDLAVQIAKRENRALREIFASRDLSDAQKEALAALPANMRDAWLQAGKAGRAQIAKDAVALARANAAAVNTAVGAAKKATGGMVGVGQALMQGVINGVTDYIPSLYNTIDNAIAGAIASARAAADAHSPSRKMFKLGLDLMTGLQNGITDNEQKVIDAAQRVIDKAIKAMTADLEKLQAELDKVLSKASSFRDSLRGGFDQFLDLGGGFTTQVPDPENPDQMITVPATGASITEFLASQVAGAQKLADVLKALKAQGASKALLSQVAQGGAEGVGFAQTLLQGGPEAIAAVNDSLKAIAELAGGTAEGLTNEFFGDKIDDLRGDVKELTKNLRVLEKPQRLLVEFRGGDANALRQYILEVLASSSLARQPL